jgi:uncharacterized membrane protein YedE/YeeE
MAEFNLTGGVIGGALIGTAAAILLLMNGRIAGVSGILGGIFSSADRRWRCAFVVGMICGAAIYDRLSSGLTLHLEANNLTLVGAGLLVGFGTRLGSGCTSGHGVCGLARRSPRSLVATATFMLFGILTVFLIRHLSL